MRTVAATVLVCLLLALGGGALWIWRGWYDVSATTGHTPWVHGLLETTMRRAVARAATGVAVPSGLDDAARIARGAGCYRVHCEQCHGGPGVAQGDIGISLQPLPGPLVDASQRWRTAELYWIVRHGIKMSGMPAWELRLPDDDLWALTAFMRQLPAMTAVQYREGRAAPLADGCRTLAQRCAAGDCGAQVSADHQPLQARDDDEAARLLLRQYACVACHRIPGVAGSDVHVGPPLTGLWQRERIADLPQPTVDDLARWIRVPHEVRPGTAMPTLGVSEPHARRMAAYLLDARH